MTDNERIVSDIIQSNELLRIQIWILGGVLSALMLLIIWFAREAWQDAKSMIENHDHRLNIIERNAAVIDESVNNLERNVYKLKTR